MYVSGLSEACQKLVVFFSMVVYEIYLFKLYVVAVPALEKNLVLLYSLRTGKTVQKRRILFHNKNNSF